MIVLKFGGTSVATPERIKQIANILSEYPKDKRFLIVVSALSQVTNLLDKAGKKAVAGSVDFTEELKEIETKHFDILNALIPAQAYSGVASQIKMLCSEAATICEGISMLREYTPKSKAHLLSLGERLSSFLISMALNFIGIENKLLDSSAIFKTNKHWNGIVDNKKSKKNLKRFWTDSTDNFVLIAGFIASTNKDEISVIGRGGSDLTASLSANYLGADRLEIWTDISGVFTAPPKLVSSAYPIKELSYEEAIELSYFGAKVIYSPTIQPAFDAAIPIWVKNSFRPQDRGTRISKYTTANGHIVKGFSAIPGVSLLTISGAEMVGVHDIVARTFIALAEVNINVLFVTQSSSEHTITLGISSNKAGLAIEKLEAVFEVEMERKTMNPIKKEDNIAIIAIVGEGMRHSKGMAGKAFKLLGDNGINIRAIAQGNSERNISVVVKEKDAKKSLNALHEGFFLSKYKKIHLYNFGVGNVGTALLQQISNQYEYLKEQFGLDVRLVGLANSKKMLFNKLGINLKNWKAEFSTASEIMQPEIFLSKMHKANLRNSIFVDNTASEEVVNLYNELADQSVSIVCSNKIMASKEQKAWDEFLKILKIKKAKFLNETNVAAGLPVLKTIDDMVSSGDKINRIQAVLSGSLNFIFNTLSLEIPFSKAVKMASENKLTEPNPAIDISGLDVRRKVLILARTAGYKLNLSEIKSETIIPPEFLEAKTKDELFKILEKFDESIEELRIEAQNQDKQLRFVAEFENGKAKVGLQAVSKEHPAYYLDGMDNIVLIYSQRYNRQPLVVKGAGAGHEVTASGVFADIIRLSNTLFS